MSVRLALALCLIVPAAARAQDRAAEIDFENALREAEEAAKQRAAEEKEKAKERTRALESTLTAMNDGVPAGQEIVEAVNAKLTIKFERQDAAALIAPGPRAVRYLVLNDRLPAYPRVYGPYIARETARVLFEDMPDSAEREYMRRSMTGRVFVELGGEPSKLPAIDLDGRGKTAVDAELTAEIGAWAANKAEMALFKIGQETGKPGLMDLEDQEQRIVDCATCRPELKLQAQDKLRAIQAANRRFVQFVIAENEWRLMYPAP